MPKSDEFTIAFGSKITERHIDQIVSEFFKAYTSKKYSEYTFDLSEVEWVSNQELVILTGLMHYLIENDIPFFVHFLGVGKIPKVTKRKAKQFVQIWDVWKIYEIIPNQNYAKYFDLDGNQIQRFKKEFRFSSEESEIYDRYGVTPFITLDFVKGYSDRKISELLSEIYLLNDATNDILTLNNCALPFENKTLSSIITKELYENFLDHFQRSFFNSKKEYAFMSLSLKTKFNEKFFNKGEVQSMLDKNFNDEMIDEVKNFYKDKKTGKWKNQSVLQLSFLDFGLGIPTTLNAQYLKAEKTSDDAKLVNAPHDTKVLRYAFEPNSSKHPISKKYLEKINVPRGLFDLLTIVRRFEGLLVARSNYGKILFDFSDGKSFEESTETFGNGEDFFPGTLISIYVPERHSSVQIEGTTIKQLLKVDPYAYFNKKIEYLSVFQIQKQLQGEDLKRRIYDDLFDLLLNKIISFPDNTLIYIDFEGYQIDERISKKIIFFLISDYSINLLKNVIIINPPPVEFLINIREEIKYLSEVDRKYKIHPTPFIYLSNIESELTIFWLGVYSDTDISKLNELLLDDHSLRKGDFQYPDDIIGHINYYDSQGNLKSFINREEIQKQYDSAKKISASSIVYDYQDKIEKSKKLELEKLVGESTLKINGCVFLCSGNYYQYQYVQMSNMLGDTNNCEYIANAIFDLISDQTIKNPGIKFICISSNSQKIVKSMVDNQLINGENVVIVSNHNSFVSEQSFQDNIKPSDEFILICDVISTGYLANFLDRYLKEKEANLLQIAVVVDTRDPEFESEKYDKSELDKKLTALVERPIKKLKRAGLRQKLKERSLKVVRINPYTNTPIELSVKSSHKKDSVLLENAEFIELIPENCIKTGYFKFNNLIHPYFFDLKNLLKDRENCKEILKVIFERIDQKFLKRLNMVFYPKGSAATNIDDDILTVDVLKNNSIEIYELERFQTNEGWRFPDTPKFLKTLSHQKVVMIFDDGSCTGDSIIQMIEEIALLDVKEILVLSIIGRLSDHKREFFSRLSTMMGSNMEVKVKTIFACHWNIPTYHIEESPVVKENEWLNELVNIPNTPTKIKEEARKILDELALKTIDSPNNKYLLRNWDDSSIIKDLILVKDQIGKIATYRYFKEYFDFFDDFIVTYETKVDTPEGYKTIELICAVFLHEPYLYDKIKNVLPDLSERLESFIVAIVFGNPNLLNSPRIAKKSLFYKWSNKNFFHLLFIFFKGKYFMEMMTLNRFIFLIKTYHASYSDLNYFFLKLLKFIPTDINQLKTKKLGGHIKLLIEGAIENSQLGQERSQLKIFRAFISTLPFVDSSFNDLLTKVKTNYAKILDDASHNEYIYNDKQIINTQLKVLNKKKINKEDYEEEIVIIQNAWDAISEFIEDLLNFSIRYPNFFLPYKEKTYNNLENITISLRALLAQLGDLIHNGRFEDVAVISSKLDKLFDKFIMNNSEYSKIFNSITTPNIKEEFDTFLTQIEETDQKINVETNFPPPITIAFPKLYLHHVVFSELRENLRHADLGKKIIIEWTESKEYLTFTIQNSIKKGMILKGGGKGLMRLNNLNDFPIQMFHKATGSNGTYSHEIKFKKL